MLYARDPKTKELILSTKGSIAVCPDCNMEMIPKCGSIVCHHWAHKCNSDCDIKYHDGISDWHIEWQQQINNPIPGINVEVPVVVDEQYKRADLKPQHGVIIEFQKSPLPLEEKLLREKHYQNMMWVVHDDIKKSKIWYQYNNGWVGSPVIFDSGYRDVTCFNCTDGRPNDRFDISKEHFIKTFINGNICNRKVWDIVRFRSQKREFYSRITKVGLNFDWVCGCISDMFIFFNSKLMEYEIASKEADAQKILIKDLDIFFSNFENLQECYRRIDCDVTDDTHRNYIIDKYKSELRLQQRLDDVQRAENTRLQSIIEAEARKESEEQRRLAYIIKIQEITRQQQQWDRELEERKQRQELRSKPLTHEECIGKFWVAPINRCLLAKGYDINIPEVCNGDCIVLKKAQLPEMLSV